MFGPIFYCSLTKRLKTLKKVNNVLFTTFQVYFDPFFDIDWTPQHFYDKTIALDPSKGAKPPGGSESKSQREKRVRSFSERVCVPGISKTHRFLFVLYSYFVMYSKFFHNAFVLVSMGISSTSFDLGCIEIENSKISRNAT